METEDDHRGNVYPVTRMKLSNLVENKRSIFDLWLLKRGIIKEPSQYHRVQA